MTLTLKKMSTVAAIITLSLLAASIVFLGNQRQAFAHRDPDFSSPPRPSEIMCFVFDQLNHVGKPLPVFNADDCQNPPSAPPQCLDGIDNDGDGDIDFPEDSGCAAEDDNTEAPNPPPAPACSNNTDDDGDGFVDENDPACHSDGNPDNSSSYDPNRTSELPVNDPPAQVPGPENTLALCSDGVDNDADGTIDLADPDCAAFMAKLIVVKIVVNDNGGTSAISDFSLHVATTSTGMAETIGVSSGATTTVLAGTWTVGEIQKSGYTATFGGDCNSSGQVTLGAGETKTCTIVNNDVAPSATACADGIDNDGDGLIDSADAGCTGPSDNDETNPPSGGSSGGGGGGGGGGSGGLVTQASVIAAPAGAVLGASSAPPVASTESCDRYLTAFIKSGANNDEDQVRRLQYVLREFEGVSTVQQNGVYDAATLAAVHAFQAKYAPEILTPWGIGKSTGFVYLTTRKKVNEIYCRSTNQFPLTSAEQQVIGKARGAEQSTPAPSRANVGALKDASAQSSAAGETAPTETKKSFLQRILDFVSGGAGD